MSDYRQIDEPQPTIVGPRPAEGAGGRMQIPQGLERLMTLAGISAEWRGKILADPLGAAAEAKIELAASETAILKSIPRAALAGMAASFAKKHGGGALARLVGAAAATAAALLVTGTVYGEESPGAKGGARADEPGAKPADVRLGGIRPDVPEEAGPVLWMTSLDDALAQAKKASRAVMAVFPPAARTEKPKPPPPPTRGISMDEPEVSVAEKSRRVLLTESKEFRSAVKDADLVAVRVAKPLPIGEELKKAGVQDIEVTEKEAERIREAERKKFEAYEAALKKYALDEKKLPAVVFLAPDGSELSKLVQPDEEKILVGVIKDVPPLLAKWITAQRTHKPPPDAEGGIRPDEPVTKGIRPDLPEGKL